MEYPYFYIEFEIEDKASLKRLTELINTLRDDKANDIINLENWISFFNVEELEKYWWPNEKQFEKTLSIWGKVPKVLKSEEPENEQNDWDIYSLFDAISSSEADLIEMREIKEELYHLTFNSYCYPYGGTGSLEKLITSFGGDIIAVDDGTGRYNRRIEEDTFLEVQAMFEKKKKWWEFWK